MYETENFGLPNTVHEEPELKSNIITVVDPEAPEGNDTNRTSPAGLRETRSKTNETPSKAETASDENPADPTTDHEPLLNFITVVRKEWP